MRRMIAAADRHKGRAPAENVMVAEAKPKPKRALPPPEPRYETAAYVPEAQPAVQPPPAEEVSYFIQLGSFSDGSNAARARDQFSAVWPVQFIELSGASGPVYRVRLGPISNGEDAQTALIDAQSAGFGDARLIRNAAVQASLQ
jgi:cell division protein FtsN